MKNKLKMPCFVSLKIGPSMEAMEKKLELLELVEAAMAHGRTVVMHAGA
jgi:hypothetical protein